MFKSFSVIDIHDQQAIDELRKQVAAGTPVGFLIPEAQHTEKDVGYEITRTISFSNIRSFAVAKCFPLIRKSFAYALKE